MKSSISGERTKRGRDQGQGDREDHRRRRPDRHHHRRPVLPLRAHDQEVRARKLLFLRNHIKLIILIIELHLRIVNISSLLRQHNWSVTY